MRVSVVVVLFATFCLAACAQTEVDGAHVTGLFVPVRVDEVRAAMAAANAAHPKPRGKIYAVHVVSATEMHIYREPRTHLVSYEIARKVGRVWQGGERIIAVNE